MNIKEKFDLTGKSALVTGAAGLLGKGFCETLAEAGAAVAALDIMADGAASGAENIRTRGGKAIALGSDVTVETDMINAVSEAAREFGGLDILVCSAAMDPKVEGDGVRDSGAFEDYPAEQWRRAVDVNLTGMFLASQAAARQMRAQGSGAMILISSTYGLVGPDQRIYRKEGHTQSPVKPVYYSVTKAGVLGLTRYLATYFAGTKIRVNALTPGGVFNGQDEEFVRNYSSRTVLGRMARADEMNGALLFLASEASSYMTGANLVVDGGWTAW